MTSRHTQNAAAVSATYAAARSGSTAPAISAGSSDGSHGAAISGDPIGENDHRNHRDGIAGFVRGVVPPVSTADPVRD